MNCTLRQTFHLEIIIWLACVITKGKSSSIKTISVENNTFWANSVRISFRFSSLFFHVTPQGDTETLIWAETWVINSDLGGLLQCCDAIQFSDAILSEKSVKVKTWASFKAVLLVMVSPSALLQCVGPDYPQAAGLFIEAQQHHLCGSQNKTEQGRPWRLAA